MYTKIAHSPQPTAHSPCTGCSACYSICPKNCIEMKPDHEGFLYPEIDREKCIDCNKCKDICPVNKQNLKIGVNSNQTIYAAINRNEVVRNKSTSGGIFSLLAEEIVNKNGVVFGAKFDNNFVVVHDHADTMEGITKFYRSKYVQSNIGETFRECKQYLKQGKYVAFSGTPCQIGGLRAYLSKDYANLFCIDIICMSVPSPKIWEKYLEYRKQKNGSKIKEIAFRYKNPNWQGSSLYIQFEDGSEYKETGGKDPYLQVFGSDMCARYSCYTCNFRTLNRKSDITIADFWGIEHICPEMFDNKGTSLVMVNSKKGEELFEKIKEKCVLRSFNRDMAIQYNPRAIRSREKPIKGLYQRREKIFKKLNILPFDILVRKYIYDSIAIRGYRFIKRCLGKVKRTILKSR
jgi:coenzyme F420-reducing hydrogenase beta subunit